MLIGVNIGPNLTYPGRWPICCGAASSAATFRSGFREFSRVGLITTPVTLVVAVLGLWAGIQLFGV